MGWNNIYNYSFAIVRRVEREFFVYYVHSYYAEYGKETVATTDYIIALQRCISKRIIFMVFSFILKNPQKQETKFC